MATSRNTFLQRFMSLFRATPGRIVIAAIAFMIVAGSALYFDRNQSYPGIVVAPEDDAVVRVNLIFANNTEEPGLMHYTEHLAWLSAIGTESRGNDVHSNAWTSRLSVGYYLTGAAEDLPQMIETLYGVMDPPDIPRDFAAEERNIVLREYDDRIANNIDAQAHQALNANLYAGTQFETSVIGTVSEISSFTVAQALDLHARTHTVENATLLVIGDTTPRRIARHLRALNLPEPQGQARLVPRTPFQLARPAQTFMRFPDDNVAPRLTLRRVVGLPDAVPYDLLAVQAAFLEDLLTTNLPGGLAGPLRFDNAIAKTFDIDIFPLDENHVELSFRASPDSGVSLNVLCDAFLDALAVSAATPFPQETLDRVAQRFEGYWPDWDDRDEVTEWMAGYITERTRGLRDPLSRAAIKDVAESFEPETTNALLTSLTQPGRTAIAFTGRMETLE